MDKAEKLAVYELTREDLAAFSGGRPTGRSTIQQQAYLAKLGVPRSTSIHWTRYRAIQEIQRRRGHFTSNQEQKLWNNRLIRLGLGVLRTRGAKPANAPTTSSPPSS